MPLVHRVVNRVRSRLPRSVCDADLIAAGTFGLLDALRRSPSRENPAMFAAYASMRIRGAVIDELRRLDWAPRRRRTAAATTTPNAEGPAAPVAAAPIVVHIDDLDPTAPLAAEDWTPAERLEHKRTHWALHTAIDALPPRERAVIQMRYFDGIDGKSVASSLGVSEARVSQLHARAIGLLRRAVNDSDTDEIPLAA